MGAQFPPRPSLCLCLGLCLFRFATLIHPPILRDNHLGRGSIR